MSFDNVEHTVFMKTAMPLQLLLSGNERRLGKGTHLHSAAFRSCHVQ